MTTRIGSIISRPSWFQSLGLAVEDFGSSSSFGGRKREKGKGDAFFSVSEQGFSVLSRCTCPSSEKISSIPSHLGTLEKKSYGTRF